MRGWERWIGEEHGVRGPPAKRGGVGWVTFGTTSGGTPPRAIFVCMMVAMICGYHAIFSAYGFWLPIDPRGSWSDWVRSWELFRHGPATKVTTRRSVAGVAHDDRQRYDAKRALRYRPVVFTGRQALSVANGFRQAVADAQYAIHACAILPQHVHVVIGRDGRSVEQIVSHLKRAASRRLREDRIHPLQDHRAKDGTLPSPWARKCWKVFIDRDCDHDRAILYVQQNPIKEGFRPQTWSFVTTRRPGAAR